MADRYSIGMVMLDRGALADDAYQRFVAALKDATATEPDELGVFEVSVACDSQDAALDHVWDAVAASGADDHIAFLEHPALPEHWRPRARGAQV
ncbi:MAG: hypothetical protein QOH72_2655 [Solirubrobacteraceae bacterium]|jgi:uncharacterized protein YcnI|nr:hypothetical protein [Solirubrobacteraceae bacterium]